MARLVDLKCGDNDCARLVLIEDSQTLLLGIVGWNGTINYVSMEKLLEFVEPHMDKYSCEIDAVMEDLKDIAKRGGDVANTDYQWRQR